MFDIVGDVHACIHELYWIFDKLGYSWDQSTGLYIPPFGRTAILVGDIMGRGRYAAATYGFCVNMIEAGHMLMVRGNHDDKIMRWAKGNKVKLMHGDDKTVRDLENRGLNKEKIYRFFESLPLYLILDDDKLVVVHAAWKKSLLKGGSYNKKCRSWCLYGPTTGKILDNGLPDRVDWVEKRELFKHSPIIVYGHQAYHEPRIENKTYGIDTGCVFGNYLTALKYPEMELVQVKAYEQYAENVGWKNGS